MYTGMVPYAAFIAVAFVTWPIIGKFSGAVGGWVGTIASLGTLLAVAALSGHRVLAVPPQGNTLLILLLAGIFNGVGVYLYSMRTTDPQITTAVFVVMTSVMMVVAAPILDWALNGATFNHYQIAGFGTAAVTIYLLGR